MLGADRTGQLAVGHGCRFDGGLDVTCAGGLCDCPAGYCESEWRGIAHVPQAHDEPRRGSVLGRLERPHEHIRVGNHDKATA